MSKMCAKIKSIFKIFLLPYLSKMMQGVWTFLTHFRDETHGCQQDAVVLLIQ